MGILDRFKQGLSRTRQFFAEGMKQIRFAFGGTDEELLEELEMLFLQADMGQAVTERLLERLREDMRRKHNHDEAHIHDVLIQGMREILGADRKLELQNGRLTVFFMVGVNGTGKTTTSGKLALRFKNAGAKVLIAAADTFRAAAIEQLQHWTEAVGVDCISQQTGSDPAAVVFDALEAAKARKADLLIIDTAGRLHNKKNLMAELGKMRRILERRAPDAHVETLLVIDATSGQNAILQADAFKEIVDVTGLVISKLDGNAKGGVTLAVAQHTGLPIYLAGLGEAAEDLMDFDGDAFARSLLPAAEELREERNPS